MEEKYKKIINGQLDIKYLSPVDLINLQIYLEQMNISLDNLIKIAKENNIILDNKKVELQSQILLDDDAI